MVKRLRRLYSYVRWCFIDFGERSFSSGSLVKISRAYSRDFFDQELQGMSAIWNVMHVRYPSQLIQTNIVTREKLGTRTKLHSAVPG